MILCEKPSVAKKVSEALAGKQVKKHVSGKVNYFELKYKGKKIFVVSAVGHLFTVNQKLGETGFPIFEIEWIPSYLKKAEFTKKYFFFTFKVILSGLNVCNLIAFAPAFFATSINFKKFLIFPL